MGFVGFRYLTLCASAIVSYGSLTDRVSTLIGTRGGGGFGGWGCPQVQPGAMWPLPAMRLGPDTTRLEDGPGSLETWTKLNRKGGYFGSDNAIAAFSLTHLQGAGMSDYGNFGANIIRNASLAALVAKVPAVVGGLVWTNRSSFASGFNKTTETGRPGYYAVSLTDAATNVETTVSGRLGGLLRFTCYGNTTTAAPCILVLDACHNTHTNGCGASGTSHASIDFDVSSGAWMMNATINNVGEFAVSDGGNGVLVHVAARITASAPVSNVTSWGLWAGRALYPPGRASAVASNDSLGAYVTWRPPPRTGTLTIVVRAALSWTSVADAWANLVSEQRPGGTNTSEWLAFETCASAADAAWEDVLSSITVSPVVSAPRDAVDRGTLTGAHRSNPSGQIWKSQFRSSMNMDFRNVVEFQRYLATSDGAAWAVDAGFVSIADIQDAIALPEDGRPVVDVVSDAAKSRAQVIPASVLAMVAMRAESIQKSLDERMTTRDTRPSLSSESADDLTVFYTALYHSFVGASTYTNADSTYLGFDGTVHRIVAPQQAFLSDLSLWDIHRSQLPLLSVVLPSASADIAESLIAAATQGGGHLPRWPFANHYTGIMNAMHGIEALLDCVLKRACGPGGRARVNASTIYPSVAAAIASQASPSYIALGYVPFEEGRTSQTLEFAANDASASRVAALAGNGAVAAALKNRSGSYRNVWCAELSTMAPRYANGSWVTQNASQLNVPHPFNDFYTEGNNLQWMFAVPHDVPGLLTLLGSPDAFAGLLWEIMSNQTQWFGNGTGIGTIMPNWAYWAGNEPDILMPWLFNFAGATHSWKSQFWTRSLLRSYYTPDADGLPGNDDYGTLSAWGVWAYLGLYPLAGTPTYILSAPVWANATLSVPAAYDTALESTAYRRVRSVVAAAPRPVLTIVAHNSSSHNIYAYAAAANGVALVTPFVDHDNLFHVAGDTAEVTIAATGLLEFWMTSVPTVWGLPPT